jgi:glutathione S-transferase
MYDSPFVRRAAISMKLLRVPFEQLDWSVGRDFARIQEYNPLGRAPTLVLDDGEVVIDSAAILDYVDQQVGPERALLPSSGLARRRALRLVAVAIGVAEKGVLLVYESAFRPADKRHAPWVERCQTQVHAALALLEQECTRAAGGQWLMGERLSQPDITLTCAYTFVSEVLSWSDEAAPYPAVAGLAARCEALPELQSTRLRLTPPREAG